MGKMLGDAPVVRGDEEGGVVGLGLLHEKIEHLLRTNVVEAGRGLVGQKEARLVHDRSRDRNALPLPDRELMRVRPRLLFDVEAVEHLVGAVHVLRQSGHVWGKKQVFLHRQGRQEVHLLKYNPDLPTPKAVEGVSLQRAEILPRDPYAPLRRAKEAGQDVEERRFATSGPAEHEVVFALFSVEAGEVEDDRLAVPMLNSVEEDHDAVTSLLGEHYSG